MYKKIDPCIVGFDLTSYIGKTVIICEHNTAPSSSSALRGIVCGGSQNPPGLRLKIGPGETENDYKTYAYCRYSFFIEE